MVNLGRYSNESVYLLGEYVRKNEYKEHEVLMSRDSIVGLFDNVLKHDDDGEAQIENSIQKSNYNKILIKKIKKMLNVWVREIAPSGKVKLKLRHKILFLLVFEKGKSLSAACKHMGISKNTGQKIIDTTLRKIRNKISYDFGK